ncbi:hypothetical protein J2T13_000215 [Paenibacillus sp. DS2015]|uniref:BC1872 family protein n=1 Tax=Paenibacillus sp. DS2015 TaxID=3373917 RepID=UPI003D203704
MVMKREEIIAKWDGMKPRDRDAWVFYDVLELMPLDTIPNEFGGFGTIPRYTTDISAAWAIMTQCKADEIPAKVEAGIEWCVVIRGAHVFSESAPEAICLAAIIAKLTE